jgi:preprotein translocase subunit SecG
MLFEVLIVIYLIIALSLIGLILIQQGKGADMGASFGAGSSATIFGSSGSGNFLTRTTAVLATTFFIISLFLGNLTATKVKETDEWNNLESAPVEQVESVEANKTSDVPVSDNKESDVPN